MVKWFEQLYMDEFVKKNPKRCMKRVESAKLHKRNITIIALASNSENLFDIIGSRELFFQYYKKKTMYVLGIAKNRNEAIDLLQQLLIDACGKDGFTPRKYFSKDKFISYKDIKKGC